MFRLKMWSSKTAPFPAVHICKEPSNRSFMCCFAYTCQVAPLNKRIIVLNNIVHFIAFLLCNNSWWARLWFGQWVATLQLQAVILWLQVAIAHSTVWLS